MLTTESVSHAQQEHSRTWWAVYHARRAPFTLILWPPLPNACATRAITLTSREADAIVASQTPIAQEASQSYPAVPIPTPLRAAPRFQTALAMQDTRAPISGRVCIALPENTNPSQDLQRAWIAAVAPIPLLWQHRLCQHASRARQALNLLWGAGHSPAVRVLEGLLGLMAVPAQYVILESTNQAPALRRV